MVPLLFGGFQGNLLSHFCGKRGDFMEKKYLKIGTYVPETEEKDAVI